MPNLTNAQLKMLAGLEGRKVEDVPGLGIIYRPFGRPKEEWQDAQRFYSTTDHLLRVCRVKGWGHSLFWSPFLAYKRIYHVELHMMNGSVDHEDPDLYAALFLAIEKAAAQEPTDGE